MDIQINPQPKSEIELTIQLTPKEYQPFLVKAAQKLSNQTRIEGFRPGKAPYEIIKQKFGEAEIMKEALNDIITHTFIDAIQQKKLDTIGQPEINITKMAPGNDLVYTAKVIILPEIKLADLDSISLKKTQLKVEDKEVDKVLTNLAKSRAKQTLVERAAQDKDLVKMDYSISIDNVPQEDGQQKDFAVYLGEKHMVPGFEEHIIGLKKDESKKFDIKFPNDYFQKNFAGKTCQFDVKIKSVYKLETPKLDDEFAKTLGKFKNLEELKKQVKDNLQQEKQMQEDRKLEQEMLKKIIDKSEFGELPDKIIDNEVENIIHELEHDLAAKGLKIETWLQNIKKNLDEFKKDLLPQADMRIKATLIIRAVTEKEKIKVEDKDIENEIKKISEVYKTNPEYLEQIKSEEYKNYLKNNLINQKTVEFLKNKIIK